MPHYHLTIDFLYEKSKASASTYYSIQTLLSILSNSFNLPIELQTENDWIA